VGWQGRWIWRALVGGLILGLPAGALLFVRVPVLTVIDVKADRRLLAVQVRAGESFVLSYRHPVTQGLVAETFQVESDGALSGRETTSRSSGHSVRLRELAVVVQPFSMLMVKGRLVDISREARPGALVKISVERRFWWLTGIEKVRAILSRIRLEAHRHPTGIAASRLTEGRLLLTIVKSANPLKTKRLSEE
jgi:hypothetical protein